MNRSKQLCSFFRPAAAMIVVLFALICTSSSVLCAEGATKEIRIGGTGTGLATMKLLGQAFQKEYPEIAITVYPSLGSTGGIKALLGNDLDIAVSSKELTTAEQGQGLAATEYGRTPFVFVTHDKNSISQITLKQAVDIFNGTATVWPDDNAHPPHTASQGRDEHPNFTGHVRGDAQGCPESIFKERPEHGHY